MDIPWDSPQIKFNLQFPDDLSEEQKAFVDNVMGQINALLQKNVILTKVNGHIVAVQFGKTRLQVSCGTAALGILPGSRNCVAVVPYNTAVAAQSKSDPDNSTEEDNPETQPPPFSPHMFSLN